MRKLTRADTFFKGIFRESEKKSVILLQKGGKGLTVKVTGEGDVHEMKDGGSEVNDAVVAVHIMPSQVEKGISVGVHTGEFTFPEERLFAHRDKIGTHPINYCARSFFLACP